jgi:hypothetical protein
VKQFMPCVIVPGAIDVDSDSGFGPPNDIKNKAPATNTVNGRTDGIEGSRIAYLHVR